LASDWDTDQEVDEPPLEVRVTEVGYADDAGFSPLNHQTVFGPEIDGMTGKDVEPTVGFEPSEFETFAVIVAVPADIPLTVTTVVCVNVPVGLTMAASGVMESAIGNVFVEGETVAVVVAIWPIWTDGIFEKVTVGTVTGALAVPPKLRGQDQSACSHQFEV
jgi:hypothetical protein